MSLFLLGSVSANAGAQTWGEPPYRGLGWKPDSTIDPALRACQQDALEQAADLLLWLVFDPEVGSLTWLDDFVQLRRNIDRSNIDTYPIDEDPRPGARTLADRCTDPPAGQDWYDEWLPKPGNLIRVPPSSWGDLGAGCRFLGSPSAEVSGALLAAALIHEGVHQYMGPVRYKNGKPETPADEKARACDEVRGLCAEIDALEGMKLSACLTLSPQQLQEIDRRIDVLATEKAKEQAKCDS